MISRIQANTTVLIISLMIIELASFAQENEAGKSPQDKSTASTPNQARSIEEICKELDSGNTPGIEPKAALRKKCRMLKMKSLEDKDAIWQPEESILSKYPDRIERKGDQLIIKRDKQNIHIFQDNNSCMKDPMNCVSSAVGFKLVGVVKKHHLFLIEEHYYEGGGLSLINYESGEITSVCGNCRPDWSTWSPSGDHLALVTMDGEGDGMMANPVQIWSIKDGKIQKGWQTPESGGEVEWISNHEFKFLVPKSGEYGWNGNEWDLEHPRLCYYKDSSWSCNEQKQKKGSENTGKQDDSHP